MESWHDLERVENQSDFSVKHKAMLTEIFLSQMFFNLQFWVSYVHMLHSLLKCLIKILPTKSIFWYLQEKCIHVSIVYLIVSK